MRIFIKPLATITAVFLLTFGIANAGVFLFDGEITEIGEQNLGARSILSVKQGGTNNATYTDGDCIAYNSTTKAMESTACGGSSAGGGSSVWATSTPDIIYYNNEGKAFVIGGTATTSDVLFEVEGGAYIDTLTTGTTTTPYENTIIVSKSGGDYITIQGAIDSITDNSTSNRYTVLVYPGDYNENVVLKDYVYLSGIEDESVRITPTSGSAITFSSVESGVHNISVISEYGTLTENTSSVVATSGEHFLRNSEIKTSKSGGDFTTKALNISGGTFTLFDTIIDFNITGTTTDSVLIQEAVNVSGTNTVFRGSNVIVISSNTDTNDIFASFGTLSGLGINFILTSSLVQTQTTGSGIIAGLYTLANSTNVSISGSVWTVKALDGGNAYGGFVDSVAGNTTANTGATSIVVTANSGNAYSGNIGAGDIWNSSFDSIIASDGMSGGGIFNVVSSNNPGAFVVTGQTTLATASSTLFTAGSIWTDNIYNYWGTACGAGEYVSDISDSGTFSCVDASTEIDSIVATHTSDNDAHQALVTLVGTPNYLTLSEQAITMTVLDFGDDTNATADTGIQFTGDAIGFDCSDVDGDFLSCTGEVLDVADNWWNADADIAVDTISESKIIFSTACASGNHYYLSGNDLACEADANTTYLGGTNLTLAGTTFNVDDAFIVNNASDTMGGTLTADGLTLGANENITLGAQTLDHDGTDFNFNDSIDVNDGTHGVRIVPGTSTTSLEFY